MRKRRYFVAVHWDGESLLTVGIFRNIEKAIEACENFHAGWYEDGDLTKFGWEIEPTDTDDDTPYAAETDDPDYAGKYLIWPEAIDDDGYLGWKARKLKDRLQEGT